MQKRKGPFISKCSYFHFNNAMLVPRLICNFNHPYLLYFLELKTKIPQAEGSGERNNSHFVLYNVKNMRSFTVRIDDFINYDVLRNCQL